MKRIGVILLLAMGSAGAAHAWEALPQQAPEPTDNPATAARIELGKMLYFDPRFSATGTVSCFSCHNVMEGGDDHRPVSIGVHGQKGGRNAPTVWNAAFLSAQFWDGRAATLEDQAKGPVTNPVEMGMTDLDDAIERIRAIPGYRGYFETAFGAGDPVTMDNAAKAIAAYERTLVTTNSPYDRFVNGDEHALTPEARRGMQTFGAIGCAACHSGAAFAGPPMPTGTPFVMKFPTYPHEDTLAAYGLLDDPGRYQVTGREEDRHVWRVPTLRNLVYTAPYFHNGAVKSLGEAVTIMARAQLDRELEPGQVDDLVAFLESLTGEFPEQTMPRLPATPGDLLE